MKNKLVCEGYNDTEPCMRKPVSQCDNCNATFCKKHSEESGGECLYCSPPYLMPIKK